MLMGRGKTVTVTLLHISQHLLGQTEDLLPSEVTLLMAFPENREKGSNFTTCVGSKKFPEVCSEARKSFHPL